MHVAQPTPTKQSEFTMLSRLAIFFSWIGIHRFYVGKTFTGSLMVLLFFGQYTLKQLLANGPYESLVGLASVCSITLLIWQFYDVFMISFGQFTNDRNEKIKLTVVSDQQSTLSLGALLIWAYVLGIFGAHRFYAKQYAIGFLQLFTLGGLLIWWILDIFEITKGTFLDQTGAPVAHDYSPKSFVS